MERIVTASFLTVNSKKRISIQLASFNANWRHIIQKARVSPANAPAAADDKTH